MTTEAELNAMTRSDLDQLAEELGLDPADYSNKTEVIAAIQEVQVTDETPEQLPANTADPLTDPEGYAQGNFPGTTSDASTRVEGTTVADVPADPDQGDAKATDDPNYPYPPAGDVDDATREVVAGEGELIPKPTLEDWVILDGADEAVPDQLDGRRAVILGIEPDQELYTQEEFDAATLTVRTRDDYGATLTIPVTGVREIQRRGVNPVR